MDRTPTDDTEETEDDTPAPAPFRVRDVFAFRRRSEPEPVEDAEPEVPPMPAAPPTVPAQPGHGGGRLPAWWEPKKDIPATPAPGGIKWINGVPHHVPAPKPKECEHPNPHAVHARPTGKLVAYWCEDCETQLDVPEDYDELSDLEDQDADDDGDEDGEVPASIRRRWSLRGSGKKTYTRPTYGPSTPEAKQSLVGWWTGRSAQSRWLLYNGVALGAGFALGVPQFFTDEVAYLVATYDSWTAFYVVVWYGVALGIWMWDFRTRNWLPPFALAARIPLISMVVGALLYGTPSLPA
ncbi:hypothetical protein [Actinacidiphila reveromycinica]|uniref:hypothetical protein n=1 Tax=Actinacidiphila reveromycinica TaxID=659352 RepID=UPI001922BA55|nr:hypothetical protein [Streptomyces sp. SN-593]